MRHSGPPFESETRTKEKNAEMKMQSAQKFLVVCLFFSLFFNSLSSAVLHRWVSLF